LARIGNSISPKKKDFTVLGMLPKDLYRELGFNAGKVAGLSFHGYRQEIKTSDLNFEMLPIKGGQFTMGSPQNDAKSRQKRISCSSGQGLRFLDGKI